MEFLKEKLKESSDVLSLDKYIKNWEEEKLWELVDNILETEWLDLEKCKWTKEIIWEINWNEIFIYNVSEKYISNNKAEIYIYIWGKRKNNYKLEFYYNIWKMITWDYTEDVPYRIKDVYLKYDTIFIQNKNNNRWYLMWEKTNEFKYELKKIKQLIIREYLNPYFSCKN
jgi:hypothetical protein